MGARVADKRERAGHRGFRVGVLGVVPAGKSVSVLSCESWCQISYEGRKGWVYKSFLAAGAPKKEAAAERKKPARVPSNRS